MTHGARRMPAGGDATKGDWIWIVQSGEAGPLRDVLGRLGAAARRAFEEGRVFVDGVRANELDNQAREGVRIEVLRPRPRGSSCSILERHGDLVAAFKPAGVPTEPDRHGSSDSLIARVATLISCAPGALHAASRLDLDVSGVTILATSSKACIHLEGARRAGSFRKFYVAIAAGTPAPKRGTWDAPLPGKGATPKAQSACTRYRTLAVVGAVAPSSGRSSEPRSTTTLLVLEAVTGRFHQLRRHCATAGCALLGDAKYSGPRRIVQPSGSVLPLKRVALHATCVALPDVAGDPWVVISPLPRELVEVWCACGGQADQLDALGGDSYWGREWLAR